MALNLSWLCSSQYSRCGLSICRCSKELNQWDLLLEYANSKGNTNPQLVLESAWRVPNWGLMKDALAQVTHC